MNSTLPLDLCAIPAEIPPNGTSNFKNPTTLAPVMFSIGVILATITTTFTLGRTFVNQRKLRDADYLTLAACAFNIAFTGVVLAQFKFGRHQWNIPICWFTPSHFKVSFIQSALFAPVYSTSKIAIFLLYRQLFSVDNRTKYAINIGITFVIFLYLPNIPLAAIFDAPSIGTPWSSMLTNGKPQKLIIWGIIQSSLSTLLDFFIFFLPLPIVSRLNMPLNRKLQVMGVFTTALMGVIASVLSLVYRVKLLHAKDQMWLTAIVQICAMVENNIAIIVGCMPAFAQLLKTYIGESAFFQSLWSRLVSSRNHSKNTPDDGIYEERPQLASFGDGSPRRKNYYELKDTMLLKSEVTVDGKPKPSADVSTGIFREVGFSQVFQPESSEELPVV